MQHTVFTFAELDFILQDDQRWPGVREALGMTYESSEGIRTAGGASLLARGMATVQGADIVMPIEVSMPPQLLAAGGVRVVLVMADAEQVSLSMLQVAPSDGPRVLFSPEGPGVFDVRVLTDEMEAIELLAQLVIEALSPGSNVGIAYGDTVLQVARTEDGWATRMQETADPTPCDLATVRAQIAEVFGPILSGQGH